MYYSAENMIKKLTDAYAKDDKSNNYKLFNMLAKEINEIAETEKAIRSTRDINSASGKTLELIGKDLGVERNGLTDEVYKIMLKAKEYMNFGTGSFNNSILLLASALNCDVKDIKMTEGYESEDNEEASVKIDSLPLEVLNNAGMSVDQYESVIRHILPAGITLTSAEVEGTFAFGNNAESESDIEVDEALGFADDEQTTGGTLGAILGGTSKYIKFVVTEPGELCLLVNDYGYVKGRYAEGKTIFVLRETMPESFDFYLYEGNKMHIYTATIFAGQYSYSLKETYDVLTIPAKITGMYNYEYVPSYSYEYDDIFDCPYFCDLNNRIYIKSTQKDDFEFQTLVENALTGVVYADTTRKREIYGETQQKGTVTLKNGIWSYTLTSVFDELYIENTNFYSNYVRITPKNNLESDGYTVKEASWDSNYRVIRIERINHANKTTYYDTTTIWGETAEPDYELMIKVDDSHNYTFSFSDVALG